MIEPTFRKLGGDKGSKERSEQRFGEAPAHLESVSRKAKGHVFLSDPVSGMQEGETLMCVHCQFHWVIQPGSGVSRGFCLQCNGPTCGKQPCEVGCVPFEKAIEEMERIGNNVMKMRKGLGLAP